MSGVWRECGQRDDDGGLVVHRGRVVSLRGLCLFCLLFCKGKPL